MLVDSQVDSTETILNNKNILIVFGLNEYFTSTKWSTKYYVFSLSLSLFAVFVFIFSCALPFFCIFCRPVLCDLFIWWSCFSFSHQSAPCACRDRERGETRVIRCDSPLATVTAHSTSSVTLSVPCARRPLSIVTRVHHHRYCSLPPTHTIQLHLTCSVNLLVSRNCQWIKWRRITQFVILKQRDKRTLLHYVSSYVSLSLTEGHNFTLARANMWTGSRRDVSLHV